jgi:hypothetical protein
MKLHRMTWLSLLAVVPVWAQPAGQIEPNAGTWKTWAISFTKDYRVPRRPMPLQPQRNCNGSTASLGKRIPPSRNRSVFGMLVRQRTVGLI